LPKHISPHILPKGLLRLQGFHWSTEPLSNILGMDYRMAAIGATLNYNLQMRESIMKNEQLECMLQELSKKPSLFYHIERISLPGGESCWYGVMTYDEGIYEIYSAQYRNRGLTCLGDNGDPFPALVYKAQYNTSTDDTLHVYTREDYRGHRYGCTLLEAAIRHCIEKNWSVSVSSEISQIQAIFRGTCLKDDGNGHWRWESSD